MSSLFGAGRSECAVVVGGDTLGFAVGQKGPVLSCPAYATIFTDRGRLAAVGDEALKMKGREPATLKVLRVTSHGGFGDTRVAGEVLKYFFRKHGPSTLLRMPPRVIVVCPSMGKISAKDALLAGGARDVITMPPTMAAAIGAGLAIDRPEFQAAFVLERDWCAFALISLSGIVASFELPSGIDRLLEDAAIHALATRGVVIDLDAAHAIFCDRGLAGSDLPGWESWLGELETGRVTAATFDDADFRRSSLPFMWRLNWQHRKAMEALDNAKRRDGAASQLHLFGPYSRLAGVSDLVARAFGRQVIVPVDADKAMVRGGQKVIADLSWLMRPAK